MTRGACLLVVSALLALPGCGRRVEEGEPAPTIEAPRGFVLVSIDTLRADHLGFYGYHRNTSPGLDELAAQSVVFETAISQAPSTLTSHLAMFTSLFPAQFFPTAAGPVPADGRILSDRIATFPQLFRAAGFRTAGHSEGGYVSGSYGFRRGFERWTDPRFSGSADVEATVARGLEFLGEMAEVDDRFLLFLHTYSVHDPYEPPEPYRGLFTRGEAPTEDPASWVTLLKVNAGHRPTGQDEARYFEARYDEGIRYADDVLARLWDGLAELGLDDEVALVVTSDHGEEFLEHGRYLHTQLYPEHLRVPFLIRVPGVTPRRVTTPVRSIDIAPTLLDLAGLEPLPEASGRSLVPWLRGVADAADRPPPPEPLCGESWDQASKLSMIAAPSPREGVTWLLRWRPWRDPGGVWISDSQTFDMPHRSLESEGSDGGEPPRPTLRLKAFHRERTVRVVFDGGEELLLERTVPPSWTELHLPAAAEGRRLRLEVDGCVSPKQAGVSRDPRCLGVQMASPQWEFRTYLDGVPEAEHVPMSPALEVGRRMEAALARCSPPLVAPPLPAEPADDTIEALRALGYAE